MSGRTGRDRLPARRARLMSWKIFSALLTRAGAAFGVVLDGVFRVDAQALQLAADYLDIERFGDIVVASRLDAAQNQILVGLGGDHDNGGVLYAGRLPALQGADLFEHIGALHVGHVDVQGDDIERMARVHGAGEQVHGLPSVFSHLACAEGAHQRFHFRPAHNFIIHNQDMHGKTSLYQLGNRMLWIR